MIFKKWKLGWMVLLRFILLSFFLQIFALVLLPAKAFNLLDDTVPLYLRVAAGSACALYVLALLPMVFYWTASRSGYLHGSDVSEFKEIKKANNALNRTSEGRATRPPEAG